MDQPQLSNNQVNPYYPPQQPAYVQPYVRPYYAPKTNGFAITGFVLAFFVWPLGLIFSGIGLAQTGNPAVPQKGRGLAWAGLLISLLPPLFLMMALAAG